MKYIFVIGISALTIGASLALSGSAFAGLQTCWYNQQGENTGASTGDVANTQIDKLTRVNISGPRTFALLVLDDRKSCGKDTMSNNDPLVMRKQLEIERE